MKKVRRKIKKLVSIVLLLLSGILFAVCYYIGKNFPNVSFEQLIYSLFYSDGTSINAVGEGLVTGIIFLIVYLLIILFPFYVRVKTDSYFYFTIYGKEFKFKLLPLSLGHSFWYFTFLFVISLFFSMDKLGGIRYLSYQLDKSSIFEKYYINPHNVDVKFSNNKKNLIYIFVESLEMSDVGINNGGGMQNSYIPNLEKLALENINFSNNDKLGGAIQVDGVGWTVGGMVAQTAGTSLKLRIQGNTYSGYSHFLPGVYSLGEILKDNGYKNYIMMGSDATFGGRREYFQEHGDYEIFDYDCVLENQLVPDNYHEWWGFEDNKMFEFAKEKLLNISNESTPFNFTMLTADTHFTDGYIDKSCEEELTFDNHYANSFYCSDKMIYDFIEWIKMQDFYKDTVVIISGDHLTMQGDFTDNLVNNYERVVYNSFLNVNIDTKNTKNRLFTTMDMYPTTLAAMGATISGDRLGLGTNLFSGKKTLLESLGFDKMDKEIKKNSDYYNKYILGDSYHEMYQNIEKEEE